MFNIAKALYAGDDKPLSKLKHDLIAFNKTDIFKKRFSDTAIRNWCKGDGEGSLPNIRNYKFLIAFLDNSNIVLLPDLKAEIYDFMSAKIATKDTSDNQATMGYDDTKITIDLAQALGGGTSGLDNARAQLSNIKKALLGDQQHIAVYALYRHKFSYQETAPSGDKCFIAKEVLVINALDNQLGCGFRFYYRDHRNINDLYRADGLVIPNAGRTIWLHGFSSNYGGAINQQGRMISIQIPDVDDYDPIHQRVKGAVISTDCRTSRKSFDPASTKAILVQQHIHDINICEDFAQQECKFMDVNACKKDISPLFDGLKDEKYHKRIDLFFNYLQSNYISDLEVLNADNANDCAMIAEARPIEKLAIGMAKSQENKKNKMT